MRSLLGPAIIAPATSCHKSQASNATIFLPAADGAVPPAGPAGRPDLPDASPRPRDAARSRRRVGRRAAANGRAGSTGVAPGHHAVRSDQMLPSVGLPYLTFSP